MIKHSPGTGNRVVRELGVVLRVVGVEAGDVEPLALPLHRLAGRQAAAQQHGGLEPGVPVLGALALEDETEVPERQREAA
jgi:hypothetical protein